MNSSCYCFQLGIDNKTRETEEFTEAVEIVEDVDEEHQISEEVRDILTHSERRLSSFIAFSWNA